MKFGPVPVEDALGGIVAHAVRREGLVLKKGEMLDQARIDALKTVGVTEIVIARLDVGDIGEDEAARLLANAIAGAHRETLHRPIQSVRGNRRRVDVRHGRA